MDIFSYALSRKALEIPTKIDLDDGKSITVSNAPTEMRTLITLMHSMLDLNPANRPTAQSLDEMFNRGSIKSLEVVASSESLRTLKADLQLRFHDSMLHNYCYLT